MPGAWKPDPVRPARAEPTALRFRFTRGRERPRGVAWFGVRSFWGHLRHFVASAIATEDVDSRDWMTPDDPRALAERVARLLGATVGGASVTERLGRDVWIDYVADTGDDVAVSKAVARLVACEYEVPDPDRPDEVLRAPRGDVLFFGGDTAYPVATADEIRVRVIDPWNDVFEQRDDGRRRVLIGIPGNHDWYDGLDGFGRLFRRHVDYESDGKVRPTLHGSSRTMLGHYAEWAREFVRGGKVEKPHTLDLWGYTAVQSASYFALPLAPGLVLLGVDRQLKSVDSRQQLYFKTYLNQNVGASPWVALPDPFYAFGAVSPTGDDTVKRLGLTLTARPHFVLSGDIHHYRRDVDGPTLHVTAGGGGAFLHPAPVSRAGRRVASVEWPGAEQSRGLLWQVPWKIGLGRSGFIPHFCFLVLFAPLMLGDSDLWTRSWRSLATIMVVALALALVGGARRRPKVVALAGVVSLFTVTTALVAAFLVGESSGALAGPFLALVALAVAASIGAFFFGSFLALLTLLGYENTQAFTALDHPGFKHFLRLRVRKGGTAVDGWCVGMTDPVRDGEEPVLVDAFTWKSR